jgi:hypothetical protein
MPHRKPELPAIDDLPVLRASEPGLAIKGAASAHLLLNGVEADVRLVDVRRWKTRVPHFICPGCGRAAKLLRLYQRRFCCCICLKSLGYRSRRKDFSIVLARLTAKRDQAQARVDYYDRRLRSYEIEARLSHLKREQPRGQK